MTSEFTPANAFLLNRLDRKLLTRVEEAELARLIKARGEGWEDAKDVLVMRNIRLVYAISNSYSWSATGKEDLVSEGIVGLMNAAERFDPDRVNEQGLTTKFSTYAAWWIKQRMMRFVSNCETDVRVPVHMRSKLWKGKRLLAELAETLGREPSDEETQEAMMEVGINWDKLKQYNTTYAYLDAPVGDDREDTLADIIPDTSSDDASILVELGTMNEVIRDELAKFSKREQDVIIRRFGLNNKEPESLEQVGTRHNVTRERIRQIQNKVIKRLRERVRQKDAKAFLSPTTSVSHVRHAASDAFAQAKSVIVRKKTGRKPKPATRQPRVPVERVHVEETPVIKRFDVSKHKNSLAKCRQHSVIGLARRIFSEIGLDSAYVMTAEATFMIGFKGKETIHLRSELQGDQPPVAEPLDLAVMLAGVRMRVKKAIVMDGTLSATLSLP